MDEPRTSKYATSVEVTETRLEEDVNISRVLREANKSLKIACLRKTHEAPANRPISGGFLSMTSSVLARIADKVKGSFRYLVRISARLPIPRAVSDPDFFCRQATPQTRRKARKRRKTLFSAQSAKSPRNLEPSNVRAGVLLRRLPSRRRPRPRQRLLPGLRAVSSQSFNLPL